MRDNNKQNHLAEKAKICTDKVMVSCLIMLIFTTSASALYMIPEFGTDGYRYLNGSDLTMSGKLMNDSAGKANANITLQIRNSSGSPVGEYTTTTGTDGKFSRAITTSQTGTFSITATAPDFGLTSPAVNVIVYDVNAIKNVFASFTRGTVYNVTLNETGFGNTNINGTIYNFSVSTSNTASVSGGSTELDNLVTNSRVNLGGDTYIVFFISRSSEIVLIRPVQPVFTGSEGYSDLTLLTLNSSNHPKSGRNITLKVSNSGGVIEVINPAYTDTSGITKANITISNISGMYNIRILEDDNPLGSITFSINSYDVATDVLSTEWIPQNTFARGKSAILTATVKTTAGVILDNSQANVTANLRGPGGLSRQFDLSFEPNRSLFYYNYNISENANRGTYTVEYIITIGTENLRSYSSFNIRGYNLFLKPISGQVKEQEGFSPGDQGYIIVTGTDIGTGEVANLNSSTGGSNKSNFTFSIKNSAGKDVTEAWKTMDLESFFVSGAGVQEWLKEEIRSRAPNASVINFTTPGTTGIYNARVTVNLNGTIEETVTSIGVQDIFLYAFPVSSDGSPAMSVSSQANITLRIEAFNPKTMMVETNISSAGIIEAFAVDANSIVTDKMLNPSLISWPDGSKGLKFYNNDTNMGFHMVKFWANITTTDGATRGMGTGFFDVKQYFIWASPASTESGNFKTFTSNSDISLRVQVMNTGFSPQNGKQVSVDEVRYGQTWEKVDFDTYNNSAGTSGTTNSNGIANLSFTSTNPLKSGWYDVRIKLTAQDTSGNYITDYGRGWFEVRSFMLWANPTSWNVKSGQNISFNIKAIDPSNMSGIFNTTVRIKKILHRNDWSQPPREVTPAGGYHPVNGSNTVDISTNMSREAASVIYTGGLTTKAGIYEFVFEATDPASGAVEETRSMIETRSFAAWVNLPNGQWNNRFGVNRTINLIVHAGNNYGDTTTVLDASKTNITSVTKMGMFGGTPYKTRSDLNITNVTMDTRDTNAVNITLSLTGWKEGSYDMLINAVDTSGNEVVTHFWIEVEVATVGLPEFYRVMIPSDRIVTRRTSFYLSDSPSEKVETNDYPGLSKDVASNFTNAKIGHINILGSTMDNGMDWGLPEQPKDFRALVNLTEPRRLHINFNNANFSETNATYTQNLTEGDIFNERDKNNTIVRRWNVTSIGPDGTIVLEGIDSLRNTYIVDPSLSKSGKFLGWGNMQDDQRLKVDLDGNNQYDRQWNNRENSYYILLADNATAGVYDTVLVSNTTNFTRNGINATNSSTPVTFGGNPIYFISLKKEGSNYMALFTSYTTGMGGMWLGTFERGKPFNIPFLVQQPGSTTGISGANVTVDKLTWYMPGHDQSIFAPTVMTDPNGLAIVSVNTTNIPTGQYLISYQVHLPTGQDKVATDTWNMPGVEIRKFVVNAQFGTIGSISTHLINNGSGITILRGSRIEPKGVTSANRWAQDVYRVGWPFDMENQYFYNATDGRYYTGFDGSKTTGSPVSNNSINLTSQGSNTTYNFTLFIPEGTNRSITGTTSQRVFGYWNISIWPGQISSDGNGTFAMLKIDYLLDSQQNPGPVMDKKYRVNDPIFWGPGELNVRIVEINTTAPGTVVLQTINPKIMYQSESLRMLIDGNASNGEWSSGGVIKLSSYRGYDVYGYNDREDPTIFQNSSYECFGCWNPTLDHVLVVNETTATATKYRVGEQIPELGNEYVGLVSEWAGKMILVNQSRSLGIYPYSDWAPDGDSYYVGTFEESDVKVDLNNNGSNRDNLTYYLRLEDESKNGVFNVTRGIFDDDTDFTQGRGNRPSLNKYNIPLDLFTEEQGQVVDMGQGYRMDERYITLGSLEGWPFAVPEITYDGSSYANLTTFSPRYEPFGLNENVTLYVGARKFSNEPVNGNVSLEKLVVLFKENQSNIIVGGGKLGVSGSGPGTGTSGGGGGGGTSGGMMVPVVYTNINVTKPIVNGLGAWEINYTNDLLPVVGSFDSGQFVAMLNITDSEGNFEVIERQFMLQNRSAFGKGDFGCSMGPCAPSSGGGGSGGGGGNGSGGGGSKVVQISSPKNNSILSQDEIAMFEGTVSGNPGQFNFTWTSDRDGYIGNISGVINSSKVIRFDLSPGNHKITLSVTNSTGGFVNNSRIFLNVTPVNKINISGMNASGPMTWNFTNFPAFWNENGNSSETLSVFNIADRNISTNGLFYNITKQIMPYKVYNATGKTVRYGLSSIGATISNGGYYAKVGLLGRPYIAINGQSNKLAQIVHEDNESYEKILNTGSIWDLGRGYTLKLIGINSTANPRQAYLNLNRSGSKIDVIINNGSVFNLSVPKLGGESNVPMFVTYASNMSASSVNLKYTWLISDYDPVRIDAGDEIGHNSAVLVVVESTTDKIVSTNWNNAITLTNGSNVRLAHGLRLIVNSTDPLDFYPGMAVPVGGE